MMKRVAAGAVPVCVSLLFVLLNIAAMLAIHDVEFHQYTLEMGNQPENYFGQFFDSYPTTLVSLGLLIFWLFGRDASQLARRARAYLGVSVGLLAVEALLVVATWNLDLEHMDCRDRCVWYVLPKGLSNWMGIASVGVRLVAVLGVYWWMRRQGLTGSVDRGGRAPSPKIRPHNQERP